MSLSIALSLTLTLPPPQSSGSPPGIVDASGDAWAIVLGDQLWVCWSVAPDCWRRIELETDAPRSAAELEASLDADDPFDPFDPEQAAFEPLIGRPLTPDQWRLGFAAPTSLWIEIDERRWRLDRGSVRARPVDEIATVPLARPRALGCGPQAKLPTLVGGRLAWTGAPRCPNPAATEICVPKHPGPRPRRPSSVRLRAGLELTRVYGFASHDDAPETATVQGLQIRSGLEVLFVLELGFDRARARADERTRAALLRSPPVRALPSVPPGPLADAERQARRAIVCGGQP